MRIITERLILRPFEKKDIPELVKILNDIEVSRKLLVVPYPYRKKDAMWWLNNNLKEKKKRKKSKYQFSIELAAEKRIIGGIGLSSVDHYQGKCEVGYWLGKAYHRKGYMTEALKAVLDFAFGKLKMRRVELNAFAMNTASNEIAKKFGFVYEGTGRKACKSKADGAIHDEHYYALLSEEWGKR